jgi:hypothetical protein
MSNKLDTVYLGNTPPSKNLELYFGDYDSIFPIVDCKTSEERKGCNEELKEYIEDNELLYNNRPIDTVGYPTVVKGRTAYIIRSPAELEELLGCGSLGDG